MMAKMILFGVRENELHRLEQLKAATGLNRSEVLRRLISSATVVSRGNKNNSAQNVETAHAVVETK